MIYITPKGKHPGRPDCPLDHKCEKCGKTADTVICMYHLPTKSIGYRYMCTNCAIATYNYHRIMGFRPVNIEEAEEWQQ